jgi:hypothetical protein
MSATPPHDFQYLDLADFLVLAGPRLICHPRPYSTLPTSAWPSRRCTRPPRSAPGSSTTPTW